MPPMTACSGMPAASTAASPTRCRRPVRHAATNVSTATATSTKVSSRLPNSMAEWKSSAPCGVKSSSVHRGQVGQPRPEPVSRTAPPVTTMPVLATREAQPAQRAWRCRRAGSVMLTPT